MKRLCIAEKITSANGFLADMTLSCGRFSPCAREAKAGSLDPLETTVCSSLRRDGSSVEGPTERLYSQCPPPI
jgi:hypothetical protein